MFIATEIAARNYGIACFFCIFLHVFQCCILSNELAELVICIAISFFAEFNRQFDNSYLIFRFHCFFVHHLKNQVHLSQLQVLQFVNRLVDESFDVSGVFCIKCCTFPASSVYPCSFSGLSVCFSYFCKICTSFDSIKNTVCKSDSLIFGICHYLNLAELDRIGSCCFGKNFECIV